MSWLWEWCVAPETSPTEPTAPDDLARRAALRTVPDSPMGRALKEMQGKYTYLALPLHGLYRTVQDCEMAITDGDEEKARDVLERLEQEVELEESNLTCAFNLFKQPNKDLLSEVEVRRMLEYLGFPNTDEDVTKLLNAVDIDGDKQVSLFEFQQYVGRMGGSLRLFEIRRKQMEAKYGAGGRSDEMDPATLRLSLLEAGIRDDAQAYWRLVVPPSEFAEAAKLVECQRSAVRHIRALAKAAHDNALPKLQQRVTKLGFKEDDLWMALAYIREMAPIIVHLDLSKMMQWMEKDTHYRNQFETASSGGLLKPAVREKWERDLFGATYDKAKGFDRCKYGVLNAMNDHRGVVKCAQYGDSYIVLKDVRLRCTFSPEDSANLKADRLAVLDYYGHVLHEYSDAELKETLNVATSADAAILGDSGKVADMKYKEAQLHGEICFAKHVDRLVAASRHRGTAAQPRLEAICEKFGWKFSWMDEERHRMAREEKAKLGSDAWTKRLQAIMEKGVPDASNVPAGCCKKGCGRLARPGTTRSGKPFDTCCRGCVMGFGHDLTCGNIDPEKCGEGMCKFGCGRPVNSATHPSGRPFDTCCRGCASGTHTALCGNEDFNNAPPIAPGDCKMRCGRPVAKGTDGRKFDTCCRGCATGKGHSATCGKA
eukprot:gb/GFBE01043716.1/.p1 GENE.gb/GFBE01043716.1/~~gb/GFBE01043716.1/.p1  ORF type:complete len:655 (+),score=153.06 gb/GFBE01043716.1/:1-1965(+)